MSVLLNRLKITLTMIWGISSGSITQPTQTVKVRIKESENKKIKTLLIMCPSKNLKKIYNLLNIKKQLTGHRHRSTD